ncbi:MAG: UDP-N-acetylglucosamine 1-carboxyvinyltransferase [Spirochaetes bacterium]|nr:UDP-N-acetylglucosamine 1-carboxyvinyltransferase [Spirochaetota bacterium]
MDKYVIHGGESLKGSVRISGSKNAALPLMVASLLTDGDVILHNVPHLIDVEVLIKLLSRLGKSITFKGHTVHIREIGVKKIEAPYELVKKMRASVIVLGPLLARHKHCRVSLPGGCAFGPRPIDLHIKGLSKLGAKIKIDHGYIDARVSQLRGASMILAGKYGSSVLATDNVLMAAALAKGTTVIETAALEPECVELMRMLVKMGASIDGIGTSVVRIKGVKKLTGVEYTIIPDRIEAGTFLAAALATRGNVTITDCEPEHLMSVLEIIAGMGAVVKIGRTEIEIKQHKALKAFSAKAMPYPLFPTDLQAPFTSLACTVSGVSTIAEGIYPDRFTHVAELGRMGATIDVEGNTALVHGGKKLVGCDVQASDLRNGAALVVAGLCASNTTSVHRIYHIDRGYDKFEEKLTALGASIEREKDSIL